MNSIRYHNLILFILDTQNKCNFKSFYDQKCGKETK